MVWREIELDRGAERSTEALVVVLKLPAIHIYTGDWRKDPALSKCNPSTRGIWIDAICAMHDDDRCGKLVGTYDQLSRICRCTSEEMRAAVSELAITSAADVTHRNKVVTIINRRMQRENKERLKTKKRVHKHRCNRHRNSEKGSLKPSSSSSSSSSSNTPPTPIGGSAAVEEELKAAGVECWREISQLPNMTALGLRCLRIAAIHEHEITEPDKIAGFIVARSRDGEHWPLPRSIEIQKKKIDFFKDSLLSPFGVSKLVGLGHVSAIAGNQIKNGVRVGANQNGIYFDDRLTIKSAELSPESIELIPLNGGKPCK